MKSRVVAKLEKLGDIGAGIVGGAHAFSADEMQAGRVDLDPVRPSLAAAMVTAMPFCRSMSMARICADHRRNNRC